MYGLSFFTEDHEQLTEDKGIALVGVAILAAFVGTFFNSRLLKKVTMKTIRLIVGVMLVGMGLALASGLV